MCDSKLCIYNIVALTGNGRLLLKCTYDIANKKYMPIVNINFFPAPTDNKSTIIKITGNKTPLNINIYPFLDDVVSEIYYSNDDQYIKYEVNFDLSQDYFGVMPTENYSLVFILTTNSVWDTKEVEIYRQLLMYQSMKIMILINKLMKS